MLERSAIHNRFSLPNSRQAKFLFQHFFLYGNNVGILLGSQLISRPTLHLRAAPLQHFLPYGKNVGNALQITPARACKTNLPPIQRLIHLPLYRVYSIFFLCKSVDLTPVCFSALPTLKHCNFNILRRYSLLF